MPIVLLESINLILAIMPHNMPVYYALNYAGIFDRSLVNTYVSLALSVIFSFTSVLVKFA